MKNFPPFRSSNFILLLLTFFMLSCTAQENAGEEKALNNSSGLMQGPVPMNDHTFPQIHTNLNGMVRQFVRIMYQDSDGNYWFGSNGDGIIRYNGDTLESVAIQGVHSKMRVMEIVEDEQGTIWFGTSEGLIKYSNGDFSVFSIPNATTRNSHEIWSLCFDKNGVLWVGADNGVYHFINEHFVPFELPEASIENQRSMLSDKAVFKIICDRNGTTWIVTDGRGIYSYNGESFQHFTTKNGLLDNNTSDILEDRDGNLWIGTYHAGVSRFDGKDFINYTQNGAIDGPEAYNFYEDVDGNVWFTAEGYGVYRYDGTNFTHYTTHDGLTTNVVQCIYQDRSGNMWFGTWQGMCIFDGEKFANANQFETWTR